jgi:two-component system nitrogen regulation response regulator NtrX
LKEGEKVESQYKILVVEDEKNWQDMLEGVLEGEGYFVKIASNYSEAKSALEKQPFNLAVIDLSLIPGDPGDRGGLQLLYELDKYENVMAAIVLTGYGMLEEASEAIRKRKAFAFIEKAYLDAGRFRETVKRAIGSALAEKRCWEERMRAAKRVEARRAQARRRRGD